MARRKPFNVHNLYPADYCFDRDAFEADPDGYVFTEEDIAYSNAMELEKYELETPMTPYERRALRRWVASGHSVMEAPPSRYPCIHCCYPPPSFLDVYREDKQLDKATKGMTKAEKTAYLKDYIGFVDESEEERTRREENKHLHSNLSSLLSALDVEEYLLPNTVEQHTPIGSKLVFSRWLDRNGEAFWTVEMVYQSTDQLRGMTPLSLDCPPERYPLNFEDAAKNSDGMIAESDLFALFDDAISAGDELAEEYGSEAPEKAA